MPSGLISGTFEVSKIQAIALKIHDLAGSDERFAFMTQCVTAFGFVKVVVSGLLSMPSASVEEIAQVIHDELIKHQLDHMKGNKTH